MLEELGEALPASFDDSVLFQEFMATKTMLSQFSGQDILGLKEMTDERKLAAMEFLSLLVSASNNCADPRIGFVLITRLVKLTLSYGLCDLSGESRFGPFRNFIAPFVSPVILAPAVYAFTAFGSVLVHGINKDLEGGYFYGNLAIKLLDTVSGAERVRMVL